MTKLEDKIIKKIYKEETQKTVFEVFVRSFLISISILVGIILIRLIFAQYVEQKTLDVLEIFNEDLEIIRNYMGDVITTLYHETPKDLLVLLIAFFTIFVLATLTFIRKFGKIRNKLRSISKFWFK